MSNFPSISPVLLSLLSQTGLPSIALGLDCCIVHFQRSLAKEIDRFGQHENRKGNEFNDDADKVMVCNHCLWRNLGGFNVPLVRQDAKHKSGHLPWKFVVKENNIHLIST